jgi:site-specific DNA-cytosine methylase
VPTQALPAPARSGIRLVHDRDPVIDLSDTQEKWARACQHHDGSRPLDDAGLVASPVPVAQQPLIQLADGDWRRVPPMDVVTAGWPCQDISAAGRRPGLEQGARSGLWRHVPPAVAVLRPAMVVLENLAAALRRQVDRPGGVPILRHAG